MFIKQIIKVSFLLFLVLWVVALTQKYRLPSKDLISASLFQEPLQTNTTKEPFSLTVKQETYNIKPVYEYELYGLVVSSHRSSSWMDISHDEWKDYLNVEDLCVVYADNISSEVYQHLKFHSGDWTCYYKWSASEEQKFHVSQKYKTQHLSNNHILSEDPVLSQRILSVKKGDQIYLKGYLVNYANQRWPSSMRNSSVSREDTGGTACEVVYVTDFQILNRANEFWRFIDVFSKWAMAVLFIAFLAVLQYEARKLLPN